MITRKATPVGMKMATITFNNVQLHYPFYDGQTQRWRVDFPVEFMFYAFIAIFMLIIVLMVRLLWDSEGDNGGERRASESSGLLSSKDEAFIFSSYGTSEEDIETGTIGSSSEDLYDGKICVICYDNQRNCFFIPCGHCISCYDCAKRIMSEANKSCPICRTIINKVRMLHIL